MRTGALGVLLAGGFLLVGCGAAAPIGATATELLVNKSDTGGWPVEVQPLSNSNGSLSAAKGVVRPGDGSYIDVEVYTFRSSSDARAGYAHARSSLTSIIHSAQGEATAGIGDDSIVGWGTGTMVFLWRRDNVVASATSLVSNYLWAVASEQAGKIDRFR